VRSVELKKRYGIERDPGFIDNGGYLRGHAHNNYLEALASTGIFGGLAFLAFCVYWTGEALRSRYAFIFVPLIAAFLVSGLFTNTFFDSETLNCILLLYLFSQWTFRWEETNPLIPPLSPV
jgi:O-antigen ligase